MMIFDWSILRKPRHRDTREAIIEMAFGQYAEGNDCFKGRSTPEMATAFKTFRDGWVIAETIISGEFKQQEKQPSEEFDEKT